METKDCKALLDVILAFIPQYNAAPTDNDLADLFDLLGMLEQKEKESFWKYMGDHALNTRNWLANNRPKIAA